MLLLQQMTILFIYMLLGYIACRLGKLDAHTGKQISWLVLNIANPAMILSSAVNGDGEIRDSQLLLTVLIAAVIYAALLLLAQVVPVIIGIPEKERCFYRLMTVFNNIGFMGFPVISAIYGSSALLYAAIFTLPYNLLFYTYGVRMVKGDTAEKEPLRLSNLLNTGILASILATALYLTQVPTPAFFKTTVQGLSNLTAPLSMMVIGMSLANIHIKELFLDLRMLLFAAVKLVIIPLIGTALIRCFVSNEILCGVCMIILATPAGSMTAMLAQQYQGSGETVSRGVALTTILSVITIPLVSALLF